MRKDENTQYSVYFRPRWILQTHRAHCQLFITLYRPSFVLVRWCVWHRVGEIADEIEPRPWSVHSAIDQAILTKVADGLVVVMLAPLEGMTPDASVF